MSAGGGDLEGALGRLLAADLGEVGGARNRRFELPESGCGSLGERRRAEQVFDRFADGPQSAHRQRAGRGGLAGVRRRQQELPASTLAPEVGDRQAAAHRAHTAVQPELAAEEAAVERLRRQRAVGGEQRQGDREIEVVALLAQVGGREVDRHGARRQIEAAVAQRAAHPLAAFAHGGVRKSDDLHLGQAGLDVDLDLHRTGFDSPGGGGKRTGQHCSVKTRRTSAIWQPSPSRARTAANRGRFARLCGSCDPISTS